MQPAPPESRRPTADIQAILDVLGRTQARVPEEYRTRLDLHDADVYRAKLLYTNLREANLQDTNLQGADLQHARLQHARLEYANLESANLYGAKVTHEQLADTRSLRGATMSNGQKYENWLKSKDREENGKSDGPS